MKRRRVFQAALIAGATIVLSGCTAHRNPVPVDVGGRYYMAGDAKCVRFKKSGSKILCMDTQGKLTGKRRALSNQELMMYMHYRQMRQLQSIEAQLMFSRGPWWGPWGW